MLVRLLAVAYSFAFKMISEIDWMSINVQLANILGISLKHFNQLEADIFAAFKFDVGLSEERFKAGVARLNQICATQYKADQEAKTLGMNVDAAENPKDNVSDQ